MPDKKHEEFVKGLDEANQSYKDKTIKQSLNDRAQLYYYIQQLNQELRKKDPENYDKLIKEYGYNKDKPSTSTTRIAGAKNYVDKVGGRNFDKSLTVDEQKNILGEDYDQYVNLRKFYGESLTLNGTNENPNDPKTWRSGARIAVAMSPVSWQSKKDNSVTGKTELNYSRSVNYDPSKEDPYVNSDTDLLSQNKTPQQYTRTVSTVGYEQNKGYKIGSDGKKILTDGSSPLNFYMTYNDGSRRDIHKGEYEKWIGVNKAPDLVKQQYGTETVNVDDLDPKEQEKAKMRIESNK